MLSVQGIWDPELHIPLVDESNHYRKKTDQRDDYTAIKSGYYDL